MLLRAGRAKNAQCCDLGARRWRIRMRGCCSMGAVGRMLAHRRLKNGARLGIGIAAEFLEFGDFLLQQAALGVRRVPDANDVVAQLLTADVGRKITLVRRKVPAAAEGIPNAAPAICSNLTTWSPVMEVSGYRLTTMPPWREDGNGGLTRGRRPSGHRRWPRPVRALCESRIERRRVGVPVRRWSLASQFLLACL